MDRQAGGEIPASRLANLVGPAILQAFDEYLEAFRAITGRARGRFERCEWRDTMADAAERLDLYGKVVDRVEAQVRSTLAGRAADRLVWAASKAVFSASIAGRPDLELAETFFNSVTRRVFATVGVDPDVEFVDSDFEAPSASSDPIRLATYAGGPAGALVAAILRDAWNESLYEDLGRDGELAAGRLRAQLCLSAGAELSGAEMIPTPFFRRKGAYLLGRVFHGTTSSPFAIALLNGEGGITVDAVLTDADDISILFSFTRSHFNLDLPGARQAVEYLQLLMPRKPRAELYIAIGHHKHGKTELYRDLRRHLRSTDDQFVLAPGTRGMVMIVFTLPGYDVVLKVIRDRFPAIKPMTPADVRRTYRLVFRHDRAGRLVEAQEFEHLEFDRNRFGPDVLDEFTRDADRTVAITDDQVVVHHAYLERRVDPLDVYLREAEARAGEVAVRDYGQAIKDLAANGIFPGELLPKNFGVTRHSRVVCYDYDELSFLTDFTFRGLPEARFDEDEMADEGWVGVGPRDVFPEEIPRFIGLTPPLLKVLGESHPELYSPAFWLEMQARVKSGEIIDIFPYPQSRRLPARKPS